MAKDVIGHINCPYCDYAEAEVKETKKVFQGRAIVMVWCPAPKCQSQFFPRGKDGSDRVRSKMRALTGSVNAELVEPKPAPVTQAPAVVEPEKPRRKTFAEELGL